MMRFLTLVAIASCFLPSASAFSPQAGLVATSRTSRVNLSIAPTARTSTTRRHSTPSDKDAEIAALEEKLRQLKQESPESLANAAEIEVDPDEALLEGQSEDSIMFSERWKEADETEEGSMGGAMKAALALGFVVFLAVFSQVPVGEDDLTKYQGKKGNVERIDLGDLNPSAGAGAL